MAAPISDSALDVVFRSARSRNAWTGEAVPETLIKAVYELTKMGPTSANSSPGRFFFIQSQEAKERLKPHLSSGNLAKTLAAPWVVIVAADTRFYEKVPQLFPHFPDMAKIFSATPEAIEEHSFRNSTLQGAYLMLAARSLGLDCGPMSGFNKAGVDQEFFSKDPEMQHWKSNFLCNIGHGSDENVFPRLPRLSFEEACRIA
jgi:3-hydroxypropanoate dehydrogenase